MGGPRRRIGPRSRTVGSTSEAFGTPDERAIETEPYMGRHIIELHAQRLVEPANYLPREK